MTETEITTKTEIIEERVTTEGLTENSDQTIVLATLEKTVVIAAIEEVTGKMTETEYLLQEEMTNSEKMTQSQRIRLLK